MVRKLLRGGAAGDARTAGGRRIAGQAGLQLATRVLQVASGLVTLPLLARTLGADGFGVWAAALAYVGLFSSFTEFGLGNAATIKMASEPEREGEWLAALSSLRTLAATAMVVLCVAVIPLALSDEGDVRVTALILSLTIIAAGASSVMAVFQSRLAGGVPLAITLLQSVLWLGTVGVLVATGAGPVTVALCYLALMTLVAVLQVQAARRLASLAFRGARDRWGGLLRLALPLGVAGALGTIYYKIDAVLVFELAGVEESGLYGAAYRFLDPLTFFPAAIVAAAVPVFAATWQEDPERTRRLVQRCAEVLAVLSFPVVTGAAVLSDEIIDLLFGDEFAGSADLLAILMIGFVAISFGTLGGYLAPIVGLRWRIAAIAGACVVLNVVANLLLIPEHGALGAAWVTVATEALSAVLLLGSALHALGYRLRLGRIGGAVLAAGAMAGVMVLLEPVGLLPAGLAGVAAYAAAVLGLRVVDVAELRALRG